MDFKERPDYLHKVQPYMFQNIIKVLVGQRRVGKSVLLRQIMELVQKENPSANLVYINKEDLIKQ